ncbi:MAG: intermembrane phospholipid transport protein YdbH family protein [bacterium]
MLRKVGIVALIVLLFILAGAGFVWSKRTTLLEGRIIAALEARGFDNVTLHLSEITTEKVVITNVAFGKRARLTIGQVTVKGALQELAAGRLDSISIKEAQIPIELRHGTIFIADKRLDDFIAGDEAGTGAVVPTRIQAENIQLILSTEYGNVNGQVRSATLIDGDAHFKGHVQSTGLRIADQQLRELSADMEGNIASSGKARLNISGSTAFQTLDTIWETLSFQLNPETDDWRLFQQGWRRAAVTISSSLNIAEIDLLPYTDYTTPLTFLSETTANRAALSLNSRLELSNGLLRLYMSDHDQDKPALMHFDNGIDIRVLPADESALFEISNSGQVFHSRVQVEAPFISPTGVVAVSHADNGVMVLKTSWLIPQWSSKKLDMAVSEITLDGAVQGRMFTGLARLNGEVTRLDTDNTIMHGLVLNQVEVPMRADLTTKELQIEVPDDCLLMPRPSIRLPAAKFSFAKARLCPVTGNKKAIIKLDELGKVHSSLAFNLSAQNFTAAFEETEISGPPPQLALSLAMIGDDAEFSGQVNKGRLVLNEEIALSNFQGRLKGRYADGRLGLNLTLPELKVEDLTTPKRVSPFLFDGLLSVQDQMAEFSGALRLHADKEEVVLGKVSGSHNLDLAQGGAMVQLGPMQFTQNSPQPNEIIPALKGFVEKARGKAGGQLVINWSDHGLEASGNFSLDGLSFLGPVQAITKTAGIYLDTQLISVMPITTRGRQLAKINLIDMDALKLTDGEVEYEVQGDDILRLYRAEWPWFGGRLGVYDAAIPLDGSLAHVSMRVDGIDLSELFEFLDIEGLSGSGKLAGELPIIFEEGEARIVNGVVKTIEGGVLQFEDKSIEQAADAYGPAGQLAFDTLTNFSFTNFTATIDGSLAGDVKINILMEGTNDEVISGKGVIYRVSIDAPMSALFRQLRAADAEKDRVLKELSGKVGIGLAVEEAKEN